MVQGLAFRAMCESLWEDIDQVTAEAPVFLRAWWTTLGLPPIEPDRSQRLTTIYLFGWSPAAGRFVGRAFRSINLLEPDELPDALGIKPVVPWIEDGGDCGVRSFEDLVDLAHRQKAWHDQLPAAEAVHIGGELLAFQLSRDAGGTKIECCNYGRFEDYAADRAAMLEGAGR